MPPKKERQGREADAPVILLGMHRSGTTMVAELLDHLGLFLGDELESNHEALYFLELNAELFRRCNATWDQPQPMTAFFRHRPAVELTLACVASDLRSKNFRRFTGTKRWSAKNGVDHLDEPWGFKDPRTVFTLPLWLELFPRARLVHVVRNGVDVANSLLARERARLQHQQEVFARRCERHGPEKRMTRAAYKGSTRCLEFEGAFALWEEYMARAKEVLAGASRPAFTVRYEEFVLSPREPLEELARYCGLAGASRKAFEAAVAGVDASRGNAFRAAGETPAHVLRALQSPWMVELGYSGPQR